MIPLCWEGYAVTIALVLGFGLLQLEGDPARRAIAMALLVAAYGAVVFLTWSNDSDSDLPDLEVRRGWQRGIFSRRTLAWLIASLVFAAVFVAAGYGAAKYGGCPRCVFQRSAPWAQGGASQLR
jgi:disulfide bond formation protein DsbB